MGWSGLTQDGWGSEGGQDGQGGQDSRGSRVGEDGRGGLLWSCNDFLVDLHWLRFLLWDGTGMESKIFFEVLEELKIALPLL